MSRSLIYMSLAALLLTGCGPQTVSVPVHVLTPCPAQAPARLCGASPPISARSLSALGESAVRLWEWGDGCQAEVVAWRDTHTECLLETKGPR